jgi:hypothetical protein
MTADGITVELAGVERVDELRELWLELHRHHRSVVGTLPLVEDDEISWRRRRALYLDSLSDGHGFLALATDGATAVGYALVRIEKARTTRSPSVIVTRSSTRCPSARLFVGEGSGRCCSTSSTASSSGGRSAT